jgi:hypothetical protein
MQALPDNLRGPWGQSGGEGDSFGLTIRPRGTVLSESFNQSYAEAPDIAGSGKTSVFCLWRIVHGRLGDIYRGLAGGANGITRQFQLIVDDQNVGWLQSALHQVLAVKETQGIQGGNEHFRHFAGSKGP